MKDKSNKTEVKCRDCDTMVTGENLSTNVLCEKCYYLLHGQGYIANNKKMSPMAQDRYRQPDKLTDQEKPDHDQ